MTNIHCELCDDKAVDCIGHYENLESGKNQNARHWDYKVYQGSAAIRAITERLSSFPKAVSLIDRLSDFFCDSLFYRESSKFSSSYYKIQFRRNPLEFQCARIDLQLGTNRMVEALCHELLHLEMAVLGYPLPVETFIPNELVPHASQLLDMQTRASNLLGHEIIFHKFLNLGLEAKQFLADSCGRPNDRILEHAGIKPAAWDEGIGYSWGCLTCLRDWLSFRHGAVHCTAEAATSALPRATWIHPRIGDCACAMTTLIESRHPNDISGYPLFCNTLLELMKLPLFNKWVILEKGARRPLIRNGAP
jgi:hypothetical protein